MIDNLYELKKELSKTGIFFCFSGPVSQELVTEIGSILEQKMTLEDVNKATVFRVFSMVVEKAQNIIRYSDETIIREDSENNSEILRVGIISVGYEESHYYVMSGNLVRNDKIKRLTEKLTKIQQMNKEDLKKYYKEQRKTGPDNESKGAGLGFIDMAKKSSRPIEFDFQKIDDEFSFFSIKTII